MVLVNGQLRKLLAALAVVGALMGPNARVGAADLPVYDPHVEHALTLLDASAATAHLRGVLDDNHVALKYVPLGPGVYARYSVARHVIEIDDRWMDTDEITLAAVLAHEATHTQDAVSGALSSGGASACIDSEVRAFRTSALFWLDRYGAMGKVGPLNDLERQLNSIADRQVRDPQGLETLVRQTYTQQCSH
ncbi:MAG: hypothetical protein LC797_03670 [Chloroflexi bacterium]|nr:hypothetical protein [Chloroflexota bacterium]